MFTKEAKGLTGEHESWLEGMVAKLDKDADVNIIFIATTNEKIEFDVKQREKMIKDYFSEQGISPDRIRLSVTQRQAQPGEGTVRHVDIKIVE